MKAQLVPVYFHSAQYPDFVDELGALTRLCASKVARVSGQPRRGLPGEHFQALLLVENGGDCHL